MFFKYLIIGILILIGLLGYTLIIYSIGWFNGLMSGIEFNDDSRD